MFSHGENMLFETQAHTDGEQNVLIRRL